MTGDETIAEGRANLAGLRRRSLRNVVAPFAKSASVWRGAAAAAKQLAGGVQLAEEVAWDGSGEVYALDVEKLPDSSTVASKCLLGRSKMA